MRIPLPRVFHGAAQIVESYDEERQCFRIRVHVRNPLFGTLFAYKGSFTGTRKDGSGGSRNEA